MPLTVDYTNKIGEVSLSQNIEGKKVRFKVGLYQGNVLAALVYRGKEQNTLINFVANEEHAKNMLKNNINFFGNDDVHYIKLNTAYKECRVLLDFFTRLGYEVKCYYCKPNKK